MLKGEFYGWVDSMYNSYEQSDKDNMNICKFFVCVLIHVSLNNTTLKQQQRQTRSCEFKLGWRSGHHLGRNDDILFIKICFIVYM